LVYRLSELPTLYVDLVYQWIDLPTNVRINLVYQLIDLPALNLVNQWIDILTYCVLT